MRTSRFVRVTGLLVLTSAIGAGAVLLPLQQYLGDLLRLAQAVGAWGPLVLAAAYVPACLFFVPGTLLTLGAGFAFGVVRGTIAVSIGSVLGASAAFLTGRTLARDLIEERISRTARFRAIDQAVAHAGFKIVLLTRLSPFLPFNLLNYAFGLTRARFRDFVLASWIGMLPGTVMYVYLGSAVKNMAGLATGKIDGGIAATVLFFGGLAATIVTILLVTRIARRALDDLLAEQSPSTRPSSDAGSRGRDERTSQQSEGEPAHPA